VAGNGGVRAPPKVGDLSNFGKINKTTAMTFGPSSVFAGKKEGKRESISRTSSISNMFSTLQSTEPPAEAAKGKDELFFFVFFGALIPLFQCLNLLHNGNVLFFNHVRNLLQRSRIRIRIKRQKRQKRQLQASPNLIMTKRNHLQI